MSCPICGKSFDNPQELVAHLQEHGMNADPEFMNNLMKGMSEIVGKMMSGNAAPSDLGDTKDFDPTMLFGNLMKLFSGFMGGMQNESSDKLPQDMPNPFENMMKSMFGGISPESKPKPKPETETTIPTPDKDENDVKFDEDSIEIPISTDDDKKKKDQNEDDV